MFDTPKPSRLIRRFLRLRHSEGEDIILDSFAGSGTTAHAVLALNKEDGGNRRFILCQMPFETKDQEKKKENIAERITAERVRRVIKGVPKAKDENLRKGLGGTFSYFELGPRARKAGDSRWQGFAELRSARWLRLLDGDGRRVPSRRR